MSVLLFLLCACSATLAVPTAEYYALEEAELHFERFIQEHNKNYVDENEKQVRFQIFKDNLERANRMNVKSRHAVFGITQFMDLSEEEFVNTYTGFKPVVNFTSSDCSELSDKDIPNIDAPESFDWRDRKVVSRVKKEGQCQSSYAFNSAGNIESQYAIKHKQLKELSVQEIIDCDTNDKGCDGGHVHSAFSSLMKLGGIETEESYPYVAQKQEQCSFNPNEVAVKVIGCNVYHLSSQESLKRLLYSVGPISVAVQGWAFGVYHGGIMLDEVCKGEITQSLLLVGYGAEDGIPYWLIKNNWGRIFGEDGYLRVQRGETVRSCGLMKGVIASAVIE